jgi:hypothetical protein
MVKRNLWEVLVVSSLLVCGNNTMKFAVPGKVLVAVRRCKKKGQIGTLESLMPPDDIE